MKIWILNRIDTINQNQNPQINANPFFNLLIRLFLKMKREMKQLENNQKKILRIEIIKIIHRTKTQEKKNNKKKKFLDLYGINLTDQAKDFKIDRVIGRIREIDRVIQILNRRTKNNPVLIGEPGVGKTAIAEGLAVRIARNKFLQNYFIQRFIYWI